MAESTTKEFGLGRIIRTSLITIVVILIIVGVLVRAITKTSV